MNRKRRSDTILFANYLNETPLLKKRKISYESQKPEILFNRFEFEKNLIQIPKTETSLNIIGSVFTFIYSLLALVWLIICIPAYDN